MTSVSPKEGATLAQARKWELQALQVVSAAGAVVRQSRIATNELNMELYQRTDPGMAPTAIKTTHSDQDQQQHHQQHQQLLKECILSVLDLAESPKTTHRHNILQQALTNLKKQYAALEASLLPEAQALDARGPAEHIVQQLQERVARDGWPAQVAQGGTQGIAQAFVASAQLLVESAEASVESHQLLLQLVIEDCRSALAMQPAGASGLNDSAWDTVVVKLDQAESKLAVK